MRLTHQIVDNSLAPVVKFINTVNDERSDDAFAYVLEILSLRFMSDAEAAKGKFLRWTWGKADWEPVVTMRMASDVANRFFQGKESVPLALALGRVKLSGPPLTLLQLAPVTNPIHPVYRAWLKKSGLDHLLA